MAEQWYADRATLRSLVQQHPDWSVPRLARALGRSVTWVKRWRRHLAGAAPGDDGVLASRSRARRHPPPAVSAAVVERILARRAHPPADLQRVPGPRTLRAVLAQDAALRSAGERPPRSTATSWRVLDRHGRIGRRPGRAHEPRARLPPLTRWQLACRDVATVPTDPEGKRQHVVEARSCVDSGTSILVGAEVRADFTEETTRGAVVALVREHGLPEAITLDRDPRFVGSCVGYLGHPGLAPGSLELRVPSSTGGWPE